MQSITPKAILVTVVVASVFAGPAEAQIINSLRGFEEEDPGWSGELVGSIASARGNTRYFELSLEGRIQFQTERHRLRVLGLNMRRTALGVEIAEARMGHIRHNYRIWSRLSSIAYVQGQYNPFIRIQSRVLIGGGGRVDVFRGNLWRSAVGVTYMYEEEELTAAQGQRAAAQTSRAAEKHRLSCFLTFYRVEKGGFDIDIWGFYQPLIADFGDARASGAASLRANVVGELYLFFNYMINYDSNPPPDVKDLDYILRSGLGWKF
jgi:hypothetical protein